jgi:hypothetical protein
MPSVSFQKEVFQMSTNMSKLVTRYTTVIAGIQKDLSTVTNLVLLGVTYTPASLEALFQSWLAAAAAVAPAKAQWQAAVLAEHALRKTVQAVWTALEAYARNQYTATPATLTDFGFAPKKTVKKDPETLVAAAEKNRATRAARHTLGKDQKRDITGTSGSTAVTPPAAAPAAKSG